MISEDKLKYLNERIKVINENEDIIVFAEIHLSDRQLGVIADPMFGWTKENLRDYYNRKIKGEILISHTPYTTREEVEDFQYLIDLGVKALKAGMTL